MQDCLRAIHGVLVERSPEHEQELSQSLHGELQKLRESRAVKPPFASFFAVAQSNEVLGKPTVVQRLHAEHGESNERLLVKRTP